MYLSFYSLRISSMSASSLSHSRTFLFVSFYMQNENVLLSDGPVMTCLFLSLTVTLGCQEWFLWHCRSDPRTTPANSTRNAPLRYHFISNSFMAAFCSWGYDKLPAVLQRQKASRREKREWGSERDQRWMDRERRERQGGHESETHRKRGDVRSPLTKWFMTS